MNQFYSSAHYRRVSPPTPTAAETAALKASVAALAKLPDEMKARYPDYPNIAPERFREALEWQQQRIREINHDPALSAS